MKQKPEVKQLCLFTAERDGIPDCALNILSEADPVILPKARRMKVQEGYYLNSKRSFPVLRLAGRWLERLEFKKGDYVQILCESGKLTISKV